MSQALLPPASPMKWSAGALFPWAILFIFLSLACYAWHHISQDQRREEQMRFERRSVQTINNFEKTLRYYGEVLHSTSVLFADVIITQEMRHSHIAELMQAFPAIQGIGFADADTLLLSSNKDTPHGQRQAQTSLHAQSSSPSPSSFPTSNSLPEKDYYAELQVVRSNLKNNLPSLVWIEQKKQEQSSNAILMYLPAYQRRPSSHQGGKDQEYLLGYVYAKISIDDFVKEAVSDTDPNFRIKIFEGKKAIPAFLLYDSRNKTIAGQDPVASQVFGFSKSLLIATNKFTLTVNFEGIPADPLQNNTQKYMQRGLIIFVISLISLAFLLMRRDTSKTTFLWYERAQNTAGFGSYEIRLAVKTARQATQWSQKLHSILERPSSEGSLATSEYIDRYIHPEDREHVSAAIEKALTHHDHEKAVLEYRVITDKGRIKYVYDHLEFISKKHDEKIFFGQVHDITERKIAELERQESTARCRALIEQLDSLKEEEQKRLAQEMHDDLGQLLAAMKMDLSSLAQHLPPNEVNIAQRLGNINTLVTMMMTSVRRIISDLPPKILDEAGLVDAIRILGRNVEKRHQITCRFRLPEHTPPVTPKMATAIYRIMQESLNNVANHAKATCVDLIMETNGPHITLTIADNGKGLSSQDLQKAGSFGLLGMRERVIALSGNMEIKSAEGVGTVVRITIPFGILLIGNDIAREDESFSRNDLDITEKTA